MSIIERIEAAVPKPYEVGVSDEGESDYWTGVREAAKAAFMLTPSADAGAVDRGVLIRVRDQINNGQLRRALATIRDALGGQ